MNTVCSTHSPSERLHFQGHGSREVVAEFDAGRLSSDGGCRLLRELDENLNFFEPIVDCFSDFRVPRSVEHSLSSMLIQRVVGLALG